MRSIFYEIPFKNNNKKRFFFLNSVIPFWGNTVCILCTCLYIFPTYFLQKGVWNLVQVWKWWGQKREDVVKGVRSPCTFPSLPFIIPLCHSLPLPFPEKLDQKHMDSVCAEFVPFTNWYQLMPLVVTLRNQCTPSGWAIAHYDSMVRTRCFQFYCQCFSLTRPDSLTTSSTYFEGSFGALAITDEKAHDMNMGEQIILFSTHSCYDAQCTADESVDPFTDSCIYF